MQRGAGPPGSGLNTPAEAWEPLPSMSIDWTQGPFCVDRVPVATQSDMAGKRANFKTQGLSGWEGTGGDPGAYNASCPAGAYTGGPPCRNLQSCALVMVHLSGYMTHGDRHLPKRFRKHVLGMRKPGL